MYLTLRITCHLLAPIVNGKGDKLCTERNFKDLLKHFKNISGKTEQKLDKMFGVVGLK